MNAARVTWTGRRPNAAELAALAELPPGNYDARPVRGVGGLVGAHTAFHWGNPPRKLVRARVPRFEAGVYELGKLRAVEYETTKGRERATWVHHFSRPYPILTATDKGRLGPILGGRAVVTPRGIEK
jgi:hypothetical protein